MCFLRRSLTLIWRVCMCFCRHVCYLYPPCHWCELKVQLECSVRTPQAVLRGILQPSGVTALPNAHDTLAGNYRPHTLQLYETCLCMWTQLQVQLSYWLRIVFSSLSTFWSSNTQKATYEKLNVHKNYSVCKECSTWRFSHCRKSAFPKAHHVLDFLFSVTAQLDDSQSTVIE